MIRPMARSAEYLVYRSRSVRWTHAQSLGEGLARCPVADTGEGTVAAHVRIGWSQAAVYRFSGFVAATGADDQLGLSPEGTVRYKDAGGKALGGQGC